MNTKRLVLHAMKMSGLFALGRMLTRDAYRILCYHGGSIGDEHLYNPKLFCTTGQLAQRLEWLQRKGFVPCSLDDVARHAAEPRRKGIPVALTLDDGWYSSGALLIPVMQQYQHTPVVYLASKVYTEGTPVIDVTIRYAIWKAKRETVRLSGFGPQLDGEYDLAREDVRHKLAEAAEMWLRSSFPLSPDIQREIERFGAAIGVTREMLNMDTRRFHFMRDSELRAGASKRMAVESHGHEHRYFPGEAERNLADIEACREHVMAAGFPAPTHYCYPSGEYDERAHETLRKAGIVSATTCVPGLIRTVDERSRYYLPRFLDGGDVSMIEFEAEMSGILEWMRNMRKKLGRSPLPLPA